MIKYIDIQNKLHDINHSDKWNERFIRLLSTFEDWSTCLSRKVACVIAKDKRIIEVGYNGAPSRIISCIDIGKCYKKELGYQSGEGLEFCKATHAEQNAILAAGLERCTGASLYVTSVPCIHCAKMIINARIKEVFYKDDYPEKLGYGLLLRADVLLAKVKILDD